MGAWFKALKAGQLPPRWAADLNYGYGTPILIFIYPWPYFLSTCFLSLGFGLVTTFKIVLFSSFFLSGLFIFLALKEFFEDEKKAFLASLFYQFHSFRLIELFVRGAFGEVFTYTFLPLALWGLVKIFKGQREKGFFLAVLGTSLLILSHNSISLSFFGVLVLFLLIFGRNWQQRLTAGLALGFGLAVTAFYWLPALWERKYTYGDLFMKDLYLEHFPSLKQLFLPNFFNQSWGQVHDIAVQIGLLPLLAMLLAAFWFCQKSAGKEKKIFLFSVIIFLASLLIMNPVSLPLWQKLPLLRQFQFSWRFLSLVVLATSLTSISFFRVLKKRTWFYAALAGLVMITSLFYWRPLGFDKIDESDYWQYPLNTTYFGEADTIWAASPPNEYPEQRIEVVEGRGEIRNLSLSQTSHHFQIEAETEARVLDRTFFFPGWRVFVDGVETEIQFQDPNYRGLLTFRLKPGLHQVEAVFGRTKDRQIAESLSLISLAVILAFFVKNIKQRLIISDNRLLQK